MTKQKKRKHLIIKSLKASNINTKIVGSGKNKISLPVIIID